MEASVSDWLEPAGSGDPSLSCLQKKYMGSDSFLGETALSGAALGS